MSAQEDIITPPDPGDETILGLPIDRFVAFVGPYIAIFSGVIADWLLVHVHLLSTFHVTSSQIGKDLTQLGVFGITAGLIWAGHQKWLSGRHVQINNQGLAHQASMAAALAQFQGTPGPVLPPPTEVEIEAAAKGDQPQVTGTRRRS
jgi:hypothetical protein